MKITERAILLKRGSYSETSMLLTCLTESHGLQTFLFQGAKKKQGNVIFPLAMLELTYYQRNDSTMPKVSGVVLNGASVGITTNPATSAIAFFMCELLQSVLRTGHREAYLYELMTEEIPWLGEAEHIANYPLWISGELIAACGIRPVVESNHPNTLELTGKLRYDASSVNGLQHEALHWLYDVFTRPKIEFLSLDIPKSDRWKCLEVLMVYLKDHYNSIREIKSLQVLKELFN